MNLDRGCYSRRCLFIGVVLSALGAAVAVATAVDSADTSQDRAAKLQSLTPEKKEELLRKKQRFDNLNQEDQDRLRKLHEDIAADPHSQALEQTATRYNQWLATLTSPQRAALLTIQNPQERIARIKELMQQQAEQRFREFLPNLPDEDRQVVNKWVGDFVTAHEDEIRNQMRPEWREKLAEARDHEARRRDLAMSWAFRYRRKEPGTPVPTAEDFDRLLGGLSAQTRREMNQTATAPKERQALLEELVRGATISRYFPPVSRDELLKFYSDMKPDDPRRERLEPLEGDALYRELMRTYATERFGGPGPGPPGMRGGPFGGRGGGPPGDRDRGPPGERKDFKGGKRPPSGPEGPPPL